VDRAADAVNTMRWLKNQMLANDRPNSKTGSERIAEKTDSKITHATMGLALELQTECLVKRRGGRSSLDSHSNQWQNKD